LIRPPVTPDADMILVDVIGPDGRFAWVNPAQCAALGYGPEALVGMPAEAVYDARSADLLRGLINDPPADGIVDAIELVLVRRAGRLLRTLATGRVRAAGRGVEVQLSKIDLGPLGRRLEKLETDNRVLRAIVNDATEAHWCIEFTEPVDVTQPTESVVAQVFENQSYWRMCNRAMAGLYELPEELDFNDQNVRLYWPRSPANESFVRQFAESGFDIKGAISVDRRHDGLNFVIENDMRAEIRDGFLYRIWGNCRHVSEDGKGEIPAERRLQALRQVFDAVPDAVAVIDADGRTVWTNAAFGRAFGADAVAHDSIRALAAGGAPFNQWHAALIRRRDNAIACNIHCDRVAGDDGRPCTVAVIRLDQMPERAPVARRGRR